MERITRFRALAVLLVFGLLMTAFCGRMYYIQTVDSSGAVTSSSTYKTYYTVKAARGEITDRNGNTLVGNRVSYNLTFNTFVLTSSDDPNGYLLKLVKLCDELDIDYIERFPVTETRPYEYTLVDQNATWQGYFQDYLWAMEIDSDISAPRLMTKLRDYYKIPEDWSDEDARKVIGLRYELRLRTDITNLPSYVFLEDVSDDTLNAILELNIPGLEATATTARQYATVYLAHILGAMAKIDADSWATYKELGYSMDDYVGASGLELAFEEYLHGSDGQMVKEVDKYGNIVSQSYTVEPVAGNNVETTIDLGLQMVVEDTMAQIVASLQETNGTDGAGNGADIEGMAVVVQLVETGEILACASYPTYDLSGYNQNYNELIADPLQPTVNRALGRTYPPGSTYKMVVAVAGLENGNITRWTEIRDKGVFTKYSGQNGPKCLIYRREGTTHGLINVVDALKVSCNYFFYVLGDMLDWDLVDQTAKAFGLGESTGVEVGEYVGYRANAETKARLYSGSDASWYAGDQVQAAIGQSDNRFTPMQLCSYVATIANGGTRYAATFLSRVVSNDYSTLILENEPEVLSTVEMSAETYETIKEGMRAVVKSGTAASAFRGFDIAVCGKTGTAETGTTGSSNASFVCFAPADDPEIAIAVYGEKAGSGAYMAKVARAILEYYFSTGAGTDVVISENQIG